MVDQLPVNMMAVHKQMTCLTPKGTKINACSLMLGAGSHSVPYKMDRAYSFQEGWLKVFCNGKE